MRWLRFALVLLGIALTAGTAVADAAQLTLYEVTETMKLSGAGTEKGRRDATAHLIGFAEPGTPLCPAALASGPHCVVAATGSNSINLQSGTGVLHGTYTVLVSGDNPVDAPEAAALTGWFWGQMDFSPAVLGGMPYGTVSGLFSVAGQTLPFTGTFRLPFLLFVDPATGQTCNPAMQDPCVQVTPRPVYLDLANPGQVVEVAPGEYSIGFPAVRFDIQF